MLSGEYAACSELHADVSMVDQIWKFFAFLPIECSTIFTILTKIHGIERVIIVIFKNCTKFFSFFQNQIFRAPNYRNEWFLSILSGFSRQNHDWWWNLDMSDPDTRYIRYSECIMINSGVISYGYIQLAVSRAN